MHNFNHLKNSILEIFAIRSGANSSKNENWFGASNCICKLQKAKLHYLTYRTYLWGFNCRNSRTRYPFLIWNENTFHLMKRSNLLIRSQRSICPCVASKFPRNILLLKWCLKTAAGHCSAWRLWEACSSQGFIHRRTGGLNM